MNHRLKKGVLERSVVHSHLWNANFPPSVHFLNGTFQFQVSTFSKFLITKSFLFAIHILCAVFVLIGFQTRMFLCLVWYLTVSLQQRNPMIGHAGIAFFFLISKVIPICD